MSDTTVKLTHPNAKKPINVRPDMVAMYESQGWSTTTEKPATEK